MVSGTPIPTEIPDIEAMFGIHFSLGCTIAAFRIWRVRRRRCDAWAGQSAVGWVEQSLFALRYYQGLVYIVYHTSGFEHHPPRGPHL